MNFTNLMLQNLETIYQVSETIYRTVATVAIVVGGLWAYMKYMRGRTFAERLFLSLEGGLMGSRLAVETQRLLVKCRADNIGTRRILFKPEESSVTLRAVVLQPAPAEGAQRARWDEIATYPVFEKEPAIEPGESAEQNIIIELPEGPVDTVLLELAVYSNRRNKRWTTSSVVQTVNERHNYREAADIIGPGDPAED